MPIGQPYSNEDWVYVTSDSTWMGSMPIEAARSYVRTHGQSVERFRIIDIYGNEIDQEAEPQSDQEAEAKRLWDAVVASS